MKSGSLKSGFTLIEMLLVVAIIALLVAMVVGLTKRIDDQDKERLCRDTLDLIGNALEQFRDFGYEYRDNGLYSSNAEREFYLSLKFPIDCNGYTPPSVIETEITKVANPAIITATAHIPEYSGIEVMYLFLSEVPDCRTTLDKVDKSLITDLGDDKTQMTININGRIRPLMRIVDPWEKSLRYDYYNENDNDYVRRGLGKKTFPIITSAGPDGQFDTADDIINRQPK
jgi:prepilin-type N-terminal cleavage/methylation domain-containing protein